jgi:hypothetical protein
VIAREQNGQVLLAGIIAPISFVLVRAAPNAWPSPLFPLHGCIGIAITEIRGQERSSIEKIYCGSR